MKRRIHKLKGEFPELRRYSDADADSVVEIIAQRRSAARVFMIVIASILGLSVAIVIVVVTTYVIGFFYLFGQAGLLLMPVGAILAAGFGVQTAWGVYTAWLRRQISSAFEGCQCLRCGYPLGQVARVENRATCPECGMERWIESQESTDHAKP